MLLLAVFGGDVSDVPVLAEILIPKASEDVMPIALPVLLAPGQTGLSGRCAGKKRYTSLPGKAIDEDPGAGIRPALNALLRMVRSGALATAMAGAIRRMDRVGRPSGDVLCLFKTVFPNTAVA